MPVHASAASIALFNTGVDSTGAVLPNGAMEQHYTLVGYAATQYPATPRVATSANGFPIGPWLGDNSASAWVGPNTDGSLNGYAGAYDYQLTFSLAGLNPATASIIGQWASDDQGTDILINGVSTGAFVGGFSAFSPFSITSGFVAGTNTLDFLVYNDGGPTGLRVEMSGTAATSAVPETATWAMMLAGFAMVGAAMRRRHTAVRVIYG
jgi:hypothetical protein